MDNIVRDANGEPFYYYRVYLYNTETDYEAVMFITAVSAYRAQEIVDRMVVPEGYIKGSPGWMGYVLHNEAEREDYQGKKPDLESAAVVLPKLFYHAE